MTVTGNVRNAGCALLVAVVMAGCAMLGGTRPQPVKVPEIVELSKSGMPAADIIAKMRASGTVYRLQASQLVKLKEQGVAPEVLDYMQQSYLDAVKRDAAYEQWQHWSQFDDYWYGGVPYNWPYERVYIIKESAKGQQHNH